MSKKMFDNLEKAAQKLNIAELSVYNPPYEIDNAINFLVKYMRNMYQLKCFLKDAPFDKNSKVPEEDIKKWRLSIDSNDSYKVFIGGIRIEFMKLADAKLANLMSTACSAKTLNTESLLKYHQGVLSIFGLALNTEDKQFAREYYSKIIFKIKPHHGNPNFDDQALILASQINTSIFNSIDNKVEEHMVNKGSFWNNFNYRNIVYTASAAAVALFAMEVKSGFKISSTIITSMFGSPNQATSRPTYGPIDCYNTIGPSI